MLVMFPEVQHKLFRDIDTVIGDRLPSFFDVDNLPYLQAFIAEVPFVIMA